MTVEEAIVRRLQNTAGVTALVGTRTYQLKLPANPTLPANRVQLISDDPNYHLRGDALMSRARVQVDSYGRDSTPPDPYGAVATLGQAVNDALSGDLFFIGDIRVLGLFRVDRQVLHEGDELRLIRISQDFDVVFERTS